MTVAPGQSLVCPIIVGRTAHLAALDRVLEQVRTGQAAPRAVVVSGEAGIGKSRLIAETVTQAVQQDFAVFQGACYETDQLRPYAPLIDLLRRRASLHSIDQFAGDLGSSLMLLAQLLPELRSFLPAASIVPTTDPQHDKHRLFEALADFLIRDAAARPTLVIIEDLHWCDDLSLEFLLGLMRRSLASAFLVVITYRDTEGPTSLRHFLTTLDREHLALELTLTRFDPGDVEAMIRAIFAQPHSVRAEFVEAIHTFTDGNPFFIEEVLKSLIAAGDIYQGPSGWTRKPIGELRIPRSVHDAVAQRVQQLSKTARHVLTLAAIAGRRFPFALLAVMTDLNEADLLASLKELIAAQLVIEEAADRFAFRHELTRHAISSTLLGRERQALHRSVGEALEQLAAAGLEVPVGELAYHFDAAQLWDKAFDYSRRAGEQARTLFASRSAADHFSRAIEAARQLGRELPIDLLVARGEVYEVLGQFESAQADFTAVLTHARFTHQRAVEWQALIDLGFLWARRDYARAGPFFQQALSLAREMHDDALIAHSLNRVGNWHMMIEQPQAAQDQHAQALAIFRALSDRSGMAETLDLMGTAGISAADMLGGREHYADAIALFRELNDRHGLASALTMAALCSGQYLSYSAVGADRDLVDESLAHAAEALTIERESDWRADEALTQIVMGLAHSVHGDYGEALAAMQAGRTIAIEIEHEQWQLNAELALGALYLDLGAWPAAVHHLEEALGLAQVTGSLYWARTVTGFLASAHIAQGELDRANAHLKAILPLERSMATMGERHAWRAYAELRLSSRRCGWIATGQHTTCRASATYSAARRP